MNHFWWLLKDEDCSLSQSILQYSISSNSEMLASSPLALSEAASLLSRISLTVRRNLKLHLGVVSCRFERLECFVCCLIELTPFVDDRVSILIGEMHCVDLRDRLRLVVSLFAWYSRRGSWQPYLKKWRTKKWMLSLYLIQLSLLKAKKFLVSEW